MAGSKEYKMAIRIAGEIDKTLGDAVKMSKSELRAVARDAANASKEMKGNFKSSFDDTKAGLESINKVGSAAFKALKSAAKVAATAVVGIGTASVKTGADFEAQMSTVKAISGATESEFQSLTSKAEEMGATTAFTATESGEAMEYMAMAGWKSKDMLSGLEGIMNLAAASGEELGTTSDIVTDALTAFNLKAKDSTHFSDVLAKASSSSNTTVSKMGETFKYVGSVAGSMGYSIEDIATAIGLMANNAVKGSQAGTSLRSIITRMAAPTKQSAVAMEKLGLSLSNKDGSLKSFAEVMDDIRSGMKGIKDETERNKLASYLAGKTGMSGLLAIVNASEKDYKSLAKEIKNANGAAEDMAKTRLDNLEGDVTLFKSAMQGAGIEIYDELKEPLRDIVQSATEWVGEFSEKFTEKWPTVVREVKQGAKDFGEFAEPFLNVGKWMVKNPNVIANTIAAIGTALATYKVIDGVMDLAKGFSTLTGEAKYVIALGGVAGIIAGIGTAIETSNAKLIDASLDKHFGDISLSMDELQDVAAEIVGSKKLEEVSEILSSMKESESLSEDIEEVRKSLDKFNWKTSIGLSLSDDDKSQYESDVSKYVEDSQKLISEKGYEIEIATNFLFDDSKQKNQILKDNNKFYTKLDKEVTSLSDTINEKLEKAMKDGLTIDLEEEINGLLDQISEITNAINDAETESSWEILQMDWSGVKLDGESFTNLQSQVSENVATLDEGAKTTRDESIKNLNAQKNLGYISDSEYAEKKKEIETAYDDSKNEAREKGLEFEYNTLMDSYGKEIASGNYQEGDKKAIEQIVVEMQKEAEGTKYEDDLRTIYLSLQQNLLTDFNDTLEKTFSGKSETYGKWDSQAKVLANDYLTSQAKEELTSFPQEVQDLFNSTPFDFSNMLTTPAEQSSKSASDIIKNTIQSELSTGVTAEMPVELKGTYSISNTNLLPTLSSLSSTTSTTSSGSSGKKKSKKAKGYAKGGLATFPQEAIVAEAGVPEMMIPIEKTANSISLWKQTGELLGLKNRSDSFSNLSKSMESAGNGSMSISQSNTPVKINFSPKIIIQGNADKEKVQEAMSLGMTEFEKLMQRYVNKHGRISFS